MGSLGRHHRTVAVAVAAVAVAAVGGNYHGVRVAVAAKNGQGRVGALSGRGQAARP